MLKSSNEISCSSPQADASIAAPGNASRDPQPVRYPVMASTNFRVQKPSEPRKRLSSHGRIRLQIGEREGVETTPTAEENRLGQRASGFVQPKLVWHEIGVVVRGLYSGFRCSAMDFTHMLSNIPAEGALHLPEAQTNLLRGGLIESMLRLRGRGSGSGEREEMVSLLTLPGLLRNATRQASPRHARQLTKLELISVRPKRRLVRRGWASPWIQADHPLPRKDLPSR